MHNHAKVQSGIECFLVLRPDLKDCKERYHMEEKQARNTWKSTGIHTGKRTGKDQP